MIMDNERFLLVYHEYYQGVFCKTFQTEEMAREYIDRHIDQEYCSIIRFIEIKDYRNIEV